MLYENRVFSLGGVPGLGMHVRRPYDLTGGYKKKNNFFFNTFVVYFGLGAVRLISTRYLLKRPDIIIWDVVRDG